MENPASMPYFVMRVAGGGIRSPAAASKMRLRRLEPGLFACAGLRPALAERAGFEPAVPLRVHMISNHAPSATRSPLLALNQRKDGIDTPKGVPRQAEG